MLFVYAEKRTQTGHGTADQCLCFCYIDSTIPRLYKTEISSLELPSVIVQPSLCWIWSKTPKTDFLIMRLIFESFLMRTVGRKSVFGSLRTLELAGHESTYTATEARLRLKFWIQKLEGLYSVCSKITAH